MKIILLLLAIIFFKMLPAQNVGINTTTPQAYGHGGTNRVMELKNTAGTGADIQSHVILSSNGTSGSLGSLTWAAPNIPGTEKRTGILSNLFETANATRLSFYTRSEAGSILERLSINGNGNVGIGNNIPGFPLNFSTALGDKISLWGNSGNHYGFGIQSGLLQVHTDAAAANIAFGYGSSGSFSERARIINAGTDGMMLNGRLHLKNGSSPLDIGQTGGVWLYKADNSALLGFMGTENNQNIGFYGGPGGWGFIYDALNSRVGIGTSAPVNRLDVTSLNNWDLTNTEGDMRVGNSSYRLKFGVALAGGGAGTTGIMQTGGVGILNLGAGNKNIMQLNGPGNYIDLTNISGGIRINGNAGTAGQVLQSNGNNAVPTWVNKPYFIELAPPGGDDNYTFITGINVYSIPIPGMDNQTIFIPASSKVMATVRAMLLPWGSSGTASGGIRIEIWESSTNTLKLRLTAKGFGNGYDGADLSKMELINLNAGLHIIRAYHVRGHHTFSGDSYLYSKKLILQVFPL